jgi:hypothetical protein
VNVSRLLSEVNRDALQVGGVESIFSWATRRSVAVEDNMRTIPMHRASLGERSRAA